MKKILIIISLCTLQVISLFADSSTPQLINLHQYEQEAKKRLPKMIYDFYAGGAEDELAIKSNRESFYKYKLCGRVLAGVSTVDTSLSLFGKKMSFPLIIAPTGLQRMAHPDGELATAYAAEQFQIPMIVSSGSNFSLEKIKETTEQPLWFQLYIFKDRDFSRSLVQRAEKAGYDAIVLTVDMTIPAKRERDIFNSFSIPEGIVYKNFEGTGFDTIKTAEGDHSALSSLISNALEDCLSWEDITWLKSVTTLPILLKGILRSEDAQQAIQYGVDGIIVSNHGGRQLDSAPATIDVLEEIVIAVDGRIPVIIDGGFRRGSDILKAIALGADAVMVGRPVLWGLAVNGSQGVKEILGILRDEFETSMKQCGYRNLVDVKMDKQKLIRKQ
ncbi:MAG: alpha-hydroxy-acid oxidizing protein [Chlamydiia bacterium]|nr:alpha-hydroxy-acid oxidizing protein [Chlamydiia bacterium]